MVFIAVLADEHLFFILRPSVNVNKTSHLAVHLLLNVHVILFQDSFRMNYAENPHQNHEASMWGKVMDRLLGDVRPPNHLSSPSPEGLLSV